MHKFGLNQTLTQTTKLSPTQIQVIRMLELPSIELSKRINEELQENPALEEGRLEENETENYTDEYGEYGDEFGNEFKIKAFEMFRWAGPVPEWAYKVHSVAISGNDYIIGNYLSKKSSL